MAGSPVEGLNRTKEALREQGFEIATTLDASVALGHPFAGASRSGTADAVGGAAPAYQSRVSRLWETASYREWAARSW